jgi:DnaJ-class molecular chaperone
MTPQDSGTESVEICHRCLGAGELARDISDCWVCEGEGVVSDE